MAALSTVPLRWEILVVDDKSDDHTEEIVRRYAASESRVRLIVRDGERGLAGAITDGWAQSDAGLIGVMDADLQHPPELLPELLREICAGSDIAIASRYLRSGSMDAWNPGRRLLSRVGVLASKTVQRPELVVADSLSGFFAIRRECIKGINFQRGGFKLLLEILVRGRIRTVREVPFKFAVRSAGTSKANVMTAVRYFTLLCKLASDWVFAIRNRRRRHRSVSHTYEPESQPGSHNAGTEFENTAGFGSGSLE